MAERYGKGTNLLLHVVEGIGGVNREADEDDVGVGVGEGTETIVVFLAGGIPQGKLNVLSVDLYIGNIVLKDGGDVDLKGGEGRVSARDTHAIIATSAGGCWESLESRKAN